MAQATDLPTTSRFHNLSNGQLADALGPADAVLKGLACDREQDQDCHSSERRANLEKDDAQADPTAISGRADTAG
jgi:hypothetical protein